MNLTNKMGVLSGLSPIVAGLAAQHERPFDKMWMPGVFLGPLFNRVLERDGELARQVAAIPGVDRASLVLNLLTEEGLPHFHRLIAQHMGEESPWIEWNNIWTAEEGRHGDAIGEYITVTQLVNRDVLERMKFTYIRAGFYPDWGRDPYQLLAYTVLQEHATQISHANLGTKVATFEPVLGKLLQKIAGDEARHYAFYKAVFQHILQADTDEALLSLYTVMRGFAMPGASAPNFDVLRQIQERGKIFTTADYKKIVCTAIKGLKIEYLAPATDEGKRTLGKILRFPGILERAVNVSAAATKIPKTFKLGFLDHSVTL